jgi:hypothetical protein
MSNCKFEIPFGSSAGELVEKAKKAIVSAGGEIKGDISAGTFSIPSPLGKISGNYKIGAQFAAFEITDKPMFISCGLVESTIQKYLSENLA